jgi:hypothetical protein
MSFYMLTVVCPLFVYDAVDFPQVVCFNGMAQLLLAPARDNKLSFFHVV